MAAAAAVLPDETQHGDMMKLMLAEMTLKNLVTFIAQCSIMFGGIVPFVPQYREIRRMDNAEGFSLFVCLTLLAANILRIMFWFGRWFELPLLVQSIVMVVCMLAMVHVCVRVNRRVAIVPQRQHMFRGEMRARERRFIEMDPDYFWRWTDFSSYLQCVGLFTAVAGLFTWVFLSVTPVVEALGFMALFCEAMLGTPQFYRNMVNQSTEGMSVAMVAMWLSGDTFKTGYFLLRSAPAQFWVCGGLQIGVDIAILAQVGYFGWYPQKPPHPARQ